MQLSSLFPYINPMKDRSVQNYIHLTSQQPLPPNPLHDNLCLYFHISLLRILYQLQQIQVLAKWPYQNHDKKCKSLWHLNKMWIPMLVVSVSLSVVVYECMGEMRYAYKIWVQKSQGTTPTEQHRLIWENNTKMPFEGVDCITWLRTESNGRHLWIQAHILVP